MKVMGLFFIFLIRVTCTYCQISDSLVISRILNGGDSRQWRYIRTERSLGACEKGKYLTFIKDSVVKVNVEITN